MTLPPVGPTRHVDSADPEQVTAVVEAVRAASPVAGRTVVVSIDGRSGSGKTLLGTAVADTLGCPVVHLDAIYPGWDGLAAGVALVTDHVLEPVARGEHAAYPRWDWMRSRPGRTVVVDAGPHLVLEGCGALVPPAGAYAAVRVWVDAPTEVRRERALSRDGETYAPHWDRWAAQEDAVYAAARPWESADLVLRTVAA
jgi:cytidylate kinase